MSKEITWINQDCNNFKFDVRRPCDCGCDEREGYKGVGYIIGNDANGFGFTIWIEDEEVFKRVNNVFTKMKSD